MKNVFVLAVGLALFFVLSPASCATQAASSDFRHDKYISKFVVQRDGTFTQSVEQSYFSISEKDTSVIAQQRIAYSHSRESVKIVEAYTEKPDGRKIKVAPDRIRDQSSFGALNSRNFDDTHLVTIIFPDVDVGDRIYFRYVLTCGIPLYPGVFQDLTVAEQEPVRELRKTYDLPKSLRLYEDNIGFVSLGEERHGSRTTYSWDYSSKSPEAFAKGSVSYLDYGSRLAVSTIPDYKKLAEAYERRASPRTASSPDIVKKAKEVTDGLQSDYLKVLAISDWIRQNIRYIAVFSGVEGIVPHYATNVYRDRYGDCKDHVALMEAMLRAVGIESSPALIVSKASYKLPKFGAPFDHVITYVPVLQRYFDTTAPFPSGDILPDGDLDKPVVLTKDGSLGHTKKSNNIIVANLSIFDISAVGGATIAQYRNTNKVGGDSERFLIQSMSDTEVKRRIERFFEVRGMTGSGDMKISRASVDNDSSEIELAGHTEGFANLPGAVGVRLLGSLTGDLNAAVSEISNSPQHTRDFVCLNQEVSEIADYRFDSSLEILRLPKPVSIREGNVRFESSYVQKGGNLVRVQRNYRFEHDGVVCTPEDEKLFSPLVNRIVRDLQAQIILQSKDV